MPDFDKNFQASNDNYSPIDVKLKAPRQLSSDNIGFSGLLDPDQLSTSGGKSDNVHDLLNSFDSDFSGGPTKTSASEVEKNLRRYPIYNPSIPEYEDYAAQGQGGWEQAGRGILKGINLTATTVAGGFGMLYGAGEAMFTPDGKFSNIWDNDVMNALDEWNEKVDQEYAPNYYTNKEADAKWYSTDNWFTPNFLFDKVVKNSGFAFGAMISGNIMNTGVLKAGQLLGRAAKSAQLASEASATFEAFTPLLRTTSRAFSSGKNIEAAEILAGELTSLGQAAEKARLIKELAVQTNKFGAIQDFTRKTIVAAYSSAGESTFEALQTSKEFRNNLIDKYVEEHGVAPTGDALKEINDVAAEVGATSWKANMALLSLTEFNQLPYLMGSSYKASRRASANFVKQTQDIVGEGVDIAAKVPKTKAGRIFKATRRGGGYVFDPKEMGQEIGQFAVQIGSQNYFNKAFETGSADMWVDGVLYGFTGVDEKGEGVGAFNTKEGIEGGIIGGLTGGLMQARGRIKQNRAKSANTQEYINLIKNGAPTFEEAYKAKLRDANRAVILQEEREDEVKAGNILEVKDKEHDLMFTYLYTKMKYGKADMITADIEEQLSWLPKEGGLQSLKDQGYANKNDTNESYTKRLNDILEFSETLSEIAQATNLTYGTKIITNDEGKQVKAFSDEIIEKLTYSASKVAAYDKRIPEVQAQLASSGINYLKVTENLGAEDAVLEEAVFNAMVEIEALKVVQQKKDDYSQTLLDYVELEKRKDYFLNEYKQIIATPEQFQTTQTKPDVPGESKDSPENTVTIKTKNGEGNYNIGEEYYLGHVVQEDKDGKEVYKFPRLTLIGENEDGTLRIKDKNGERDISKAEFENYGLMSKKHVQEDPDAAFYVDNANEIIIWNQGKNKGGEKRGRLRYYAKSGDLYFVYKTAKGKTKSKLIGVDSFKPKPGYSRGIFYKSGKVLTAADNKNIAKGETSGKTEASILKRRSKRLEILTELYVELSDNHEARQKTIESHKREVAILEKQLAELTKEIETKAEVKKSATRTVKFKKVTKDAFKRAIALSRSIDKLKQEIVTLEEEGSNVDDQLEYINNLAEDLDTLPDDYKEFLSQLRLDKAILIEAAQNNVKQINAIQSLIKSTERVVKSAIDMAGSFISTLERRYPNVPRVMGQPWLDYIKTNPLFAFDTISSEGISGPQEAINNYREELRLVDEQVGYIEDAEIIPNQTRVEKLNEHLDLMKEDMVHLEKQIDIMQPVLDKFQAIYDDFQQQKKEQQALVKNKELQSKIVGTHSTLQEIVPPNLKYEPFAKKILKKVISSTMISSKWTKPHHLRADRFAARLKKSKDNTIKGVLVTAKTEVELGLEGFTQHLKENAEGPMDPKTVIALVFVKVDADGTYKLVNEFGTPLSDDERLDILNTSVYQVFPTEKLKAEYGGKVTSMLRAEDEKNRPAIVEQYTAWREGVLAEEQPTAPLDITPSFGTLQRVKKTITKDGKEVEVDDYDAKVSVVDSQLIEESDLNTQPVIKVATPVAPDTSITVGDVTYENAAGRVFLKQEDGIVPLNNRKLNKKEAETIFKVLKQLSNNLINDATLTLDSQDLINWLKTVVYWGIPQNKAGNNSLWFEETISLDNKPAFKLFMSGKGEFTAFDPTSLEENKDALIAVLEDFWHSVNSTETDRNWDSDYAQITDVDSTGKPVVKLWKNYQTYLLSKEGRSSEDIPLTTAVAPIKDENDFNRKGIYFTVVDNMGMFVAPKVEATPKVAPTKQPITPPITPLTPPPPAAASGNKLMDSFEEPENPTAETFLETSKTFVKDGKTQNVWNWVPPGETYSTGYISFLINENGSVIPESINLTGKGLIAQMKLSYPTDAELQPAMARFLDKRINPVIDPLADVVVPEPSPAVIEQEKTPDVQDEEFDEETDDAVDPNLGDFKLKVNEEDETWSTVDWVKAEAFFKKVLPQMPFYRVKNLILATKNRHAYGMFHKGAVYVSQQADTGTVYHEVFEAVWKTFATPEEQKEITKEFRSRKGEFKDRFSKEDRWIKYSEATYSEMKEEMAEQFSDYKLTGKLPKRAGSIWSKLLRDLMNWINNMVNGPQAANNVNQLFKRINKGYYAKSNPYNAQLSYAESGITDIEDARGDNTSEFKLVPAKEQHDILQHMTFLTIKKVIADNNLFNPLALNGSAIYEDLYKQVRNLLLWQGKVIKREKAAAQDRLDKKLLSPYEYKNKLAHLDRQEAEAKKIYSAFKSDWTNIVAKHKDILLSYSITFDANDELILTDDANSGKGDYQDARKIDHFRKTNASIKLLLATLPELEIGSKGLTPKLSSIGGYTLLDNNRVFINLMENLHSSKNLEDMVGRIKELAENDPNYDLLHKRLFNVGYGESIDWRGLNETNVKLISSFWKAFKKQNPDVATVFMLSNGEVVVSDTALTNAAKAAKRTMMYDMVSYLKNESPYIGFDSKELTYSSTAAIQNVTFDPNNLKTYISFLNNVGIDSFTEESVEEFDKEQVNAFRDNVTRLRDSLAQVKDVSSFNAKTINAEGRLFNLGLLYSSLEQVEYESTYFNVNGERSQTFIGTNLMSGLFDAISNINNISELSGTAYEYLLTDKFSQGSAVLDYMFDSTTGAKKSGRESMLKPTVVDGSVNEVKNKKTESSKLTYRQRLIQEINANVNGIFLNLIPGDASIEWGIKMFSGKGNELVSRTAYKAGKHIDIFKKYLESEIELARDTTRLDVATGVKTDLRFFKGILSEATHKKIVEDTETAPADVIIKNRVAIEREIQTFISQDAKQTFAMLSNYNIVMPGGGIGTYQATEIDLLNESASLEDMYSKLEELSVNYMMANIEMHKLLYSDPYQYTDELKRIKSFTSPRQMLMHGSENVSMSLDAVYNKDYSSDDIAWTDMYKQDFNAVTLGDVWAYNDGLPGYENPYEETDGQGIVTLKAKRLMDLLAGEWDDMKELQYRYDMAYEKFHKGIELTEYESTIYNPTLQGADNPGVQSLYTNLKPIVTGSKNSERGYNDIVLDKFALVTYSWRILHQMNPDSNALKLYDKMQNENVDYAIFKSGRKIGSEVISEIYNKDGSFKKQPFSTKAQKDDVKSPQSVLKIPYSIMGIQTEVPTKAGDTLTQGSQITKLATMDFMEAGVPIDFVSEAKTFEDKFAEWIALSEEAKKEASPLYKEIQNNQKLLEARINKGVTSLLKKLGLRKKGNGYEIFDRSKLKETLKSEILKREVNENITNALNSFTNGDVVLEATPAYKQIRNILFSIASKTVVKPKLTGGMRVQVASTLLEANKVKSKTFTRKDGSTYEGYVSDNLRFYINEDGKRTCEIMIGRWFESPLSDEDLLKYLNETEEGKKLLEGIGFRIPTQQQNSIEAFVVGKFLPKEFKDSVVVPSELVRKSGSDFDIDKLSLYLKNVLGGRKPRMVEYLTEDNSTVDQRYIEWVRDAAEYDAKRYVSFLSRDEVKKINDKYSAIKDDAFTDYAFKKDHVKDVARDLYDDSFAEKDRLITEQDEAVDQVYKNGASIFRGLDQSIRLNYYALRDGMDASQTFGIERATNFLALTRKYLKNPKTLALEDQLRLTKMVDLYKKELELRGASKPYLDEVYANIELIKDSKSATIDKLIMEVKAATAEANEKADAERLEFQNEWAQEVASKDDLTSFEDFKGLSIYDQNGKGALENEYVQSLFNLTTHELNFDRLILPNSADVAKALSVEIRDKRKLPIIDYSTPSNMLKRSNMSRLRHYFVSGKYAIGIAAVGQTNNAGNQRSLMTIDNARLEDENVNIPLDERFWLGDGKIKFSRFNKFDGKPTLSMPKNADGQYISNIIGQVIDGYVDITKDPWIMELGITPNVAGTWLFLLKVGVPFDQVAYFMNQPIIVDYVSKIENAGYKWLFIDQMASDTLNEYKPTRDISIDVIPENLGDTVGKAKKDLNNTQKNTQQFVLKEFLKYAMMSNHLMSVTQGSNFDTANFNDPFLIFKKQMQLNRARNTMISSVDNLIDDSFLKTLYDGIGDIRDSFSEILISDRKSSTRIVLEEVLRPYINLSDKEFVKIAQKAVENLFDYAVQTNTGLNKKVKSLLLSDEKKNVAKRILNLKKIVAADKTHPLHNNRILESLQIYPGRNSKTVNNLYIKAKDNKVLNQDFVINSFRELKEYLVDVDAEVYTNLVNLAVVQSGLTASPISFTHLLPYDDFSQIYNETLSKIETLENLSVFKDLNVLERTNAMNSDIVPAIPNVWRQSQKNPEKWYNFNESFLDNDLKEAMNRKEIPKMINVGALTYNAKFDIVAYQWDNFPGVSRGNIKRVKAAMIKKGDYSFIQKGLFQKVYYTNKNGDRVPLSQISEPNKNGDVFEHFIYKAINTWGDSFRAQEFYEEAVQSQLDTQYIKVDEVHDSVIEKAMSGVKAPIKPDKFPFRPDNYTKVHSGEKTTTVRTLNYESGIYKVYGRNFEITNRGLLTVEEAGGKEAIKNSAAYGAQGPRFTPTKEFLNGKRTLYVYDIKPTTKQVTKVKNVKSKNPNSTYTLKDGKTYKFSDINYELLVSLGYTDSKERGKILKIVC